METGQVFVLAVVSPGSVADISRIVASIQCRLQEYGCLFAFYKTGSFQDGSFQAIAEFCEVSAAAAAITSSIASLEEEVNKLCPGPHVAENH